MRGERPAVDEAFGRLPGDTMRPPDYGRATYAVSPI
ncbi:hypothetical protein UA11_01776 [Burkholderia multivorans]|nr:hypothetical protein UA12_01783 [Burkholderia multivorans]SAK33122.1 hypothetical protein UA11_01776 [Burkholderia multivorans]